MSGGGVPKELLLLDLHDRELRYLLFLIQYGKGGSNWTVYGNVNPDDHMALFCGMNARTVRRARRELQARKLLLIHSDNLGRPTIKLNWDVLRPMLTEARDRFDIRRKVSVVWWPMLLEVMTEAEVYEYVRRYRDGLTKAAEHSGEYVSVASILDDAVTLTCVVAQARRGKVIKLHDRGKPRSVDSVVAKYGLTEGALKAL